MRARRRTEPIIVEPGARDFRLAQHTAGHMIARSSLRGEISGHCTFDGHRLFWALRKSESATEPHKTHNGCDWKATTAAHAIVDFPRLAHAQLDVFVSVCCRRFGVKLHLYSIEKPRHCTHLCDSHSTHRGFRTHFHNAYAFSCTLCFVCVCT